MKNLSFKIAIVFCLGTLVFSCKKEPEELIVQRNVVWKLDRMETDYSERGKAADGSMGYYKISETTEWPFQYFYLDFDKDGLLTVYAKFLKDSTFSKMDFFSRIFKKSGANLGEKMSFQETYATDFSNNNIIIGEDSIRFLGYFKSSNFKFHSKDDIQLVEEYFYENKGKWVGTDMYFTRVKKRDIPKN
jgi:hypothetical protein